MQSPARIVWTDHKYWRLWVVGGATLAAACSATDLPVMAPVEVSGSVQTLVVNRRTSEGQSDLATTAATNIAARTYVWQPWFATVSADANVAYDFSTNEDIGSSLRAGGSVKLDILPKSKYPVSISAGHHESGLEGDHITGSFVRDFASIRARAAITPTISSGFLVSWDRVDQSESGTRNSINSNLSVDKRFTKEDNFLGLTSVGLHAVYRKNDFASAELNKDDTLFENGNIRLTFHGEPLSNVVVDGRFGARLLNFESKGDEDSRLVAQGLTTVQWRPKDYPFTVSGALRVLWEDFEQADSGERRNSSTKLASATAGIRWPLNDNLSFNLGARLNYEDVNRDDGIEFEGDSDETGARIEGGFIFSANYSSDIHDISGFGWRWNTQVLTNDGFDTEAGFDSSNLFQLQHQIDRNLTSLLSLPLTASLSQGIILRMDTEDDDGPFSAGLTHSLSLGYNRLDGSSNRYARLTVRDSRNIVGETRSLQSIQFRLGERLTLSRYQRISGDVSARAGRREARDGDVDTSVFVAADVRYEHRQLFDVDGLSFRSILRANILDLEALFGVEDEEIAGFSNISNDWRNILAYRIGRLTTEAEASAFHQDDGLGYLFMLRLRRDFGGTF